MAMRDGSRYNRFKCDDLSDSERLSDTFQACAKTACELLIFLRKASQCISTCSNRRQAQPCTHLPATRMVASCLKTMALGVQQDRSGRINTLRIGSPGRK